MAHGKSLELRKIQPKPPKVISHFPGINRHERRKLASRKYQNLSKKLHEKRQKEELRIRQKNIKEKKVTSVQPGFFKRLFGRQKTH